MGKMDWLVKGHLDGTVNYEIKNTLRRHGAISKPTGSGKSSLFINDIVYRILYRSENKLLINISTPIIKLCEMQGNDLLEVLNGIYKEKNIDLSRIKFFLNNSGDMGAYQKQLNSTMETSMESFRDIYDKFIDNPQVDVAIVISCHPSLAERLIPWIKKYNFENIDIVTYIDEAHTVSSKIVSREDDETEMDLASLCSKSDVYLISATNKQELVKLVNSFDNVNDDSYIIVETPADAINANKICAPAISIKQTTTGEIDIDLCIGFMNSISKDGNVHKVLISCKDTKQLKTLREQIKAYGFTVFSTCSAEGMNTDLELEGTKNKFNDVTEFIKAIDNFNENCFILHIRQMISGIDVGTISDCIIQKNDTDNENSYATVVQTIGRSLRLGKERGKSIENRNKKFANVLFVTNEENENVRFDIDYFMVNYYGHGNYEFHIGKAGIKFSKNDDETLEINDPWKQMFNKVTNNEINYWENIKTNIKAYVINKVKPVIDNYVGLGFDIHTAVLNEIENIERKYNENLDSIYLFKYTSSNNLRADIEQIVSDVLKMNFIRTKIA